MYIHDYNCFIFQQTRTYILISRMSPNVRTLWLFPRSFSIEIACCFCPDSWCCSTAPPMRSLKALACNPCYRSIKLSKWFFNSPPGSQDDSSLECLGMAIFHSELCWRCYWKKGWAKILKLLVRKLDPKHFLSKTVLSFVFSKFWHSYKKIWVDANIWAPVTII